KIDRGNKTILYAPTWKDNENSTSFFHFFEKIIKQLPQKYNLIIKIHPNLEAKNAPEFHRIYNEISAPNILLLHQSPLIYPLLNNCDIYLGDFSSIGYDFLCFKRPMFFLDHLNRENLDNPSLYLFRCGHNIPKEHWDGIFNFIEEHLENSSRDVQSKIYEYAFGKEPSAGKIKKKILDNI
ncbi:MAG: CDP-glycerol glycerophosphotransferase family protein, partial [Parachlamydiales bacterium]